MRHILLAIQFFTRIPITGRLADWVGFSPAMLRASAAHFPAVGWVVGGIGAGVLGGAGAALMHAGHTDSTSVGVAVVLSTMATVLVTGAFHEDGLADVADGLGGSPQRERALDIMKDSRIGAFGAMALVLALALKFGLLVLLAGQGGAALGQVCVAMVCAHVLSRCAPLWLIRWLPHVGDTANSKSKPLADQITASALGVACLWSLPALALGTYAYGAVKTAVALVALGLALMGMHRWFQHRLQGFTGDCLGATQQVCELAFYLGLALVP
jgi:adenosylcobinamide-GDP ribazoletransferase